MSECPFECGYFLITPDPYKLSLHVEINHSEFSESGFALRDDASIALAHQLQHEEEEALKGAELDTTSQSLALSLSRHQYDTTNQPNSGQELKSSDVDFVECSICLEIVYLLSYNDHLDIHASLDDTSNTITKMIETNHRADDSLPTKTKPRGQHNTTVQDTRKRKKESTLSRPIAPSLQDSVSVDSNDSSKFRSFSQKYGVRLGKHELGPYADEKRMPSQLYDELKHGPLVRHINHIGRDGRLVRETFIDNEVSGIVPVLAELSTMSESVERSYFCHPSVQHVFKRKGHGGFCGYLNIQMQISYMQGAQARGHERFGKHVPGILDIQEMIENAWDNGCGSVGRVETGGVRNTRKWIGTPEVVAIYEDLDISHHSNAHFHHDTKRAHHALLDFVETYFSQDRSATGKTRTTVCAPIYFQQPGHSMTIVGLEVQRDGSRNLLVFDPGFGPSHHIRNLVGKKNLSKRVPNQGLDKLMRAYRRTSAQLKKYESFETLSLTALPPPVPV